MIFLDTLLRISEITVGRSPVLSRILWQGVCFVPSSCSCSMFEVIWLWKWAGFPCVGTVTQKLHPEIQSCSCRASPAEQYLCVSNETFWFPMGSVSAQCLGFVGVNLGFLCLELSALFLWGFGEELWHFGWKVEMDFGCLQSPSTTVDHCFSLLLSSQNPVLEENPKRMCQVCSEMGWWTASTKKCSKS